MDQKETLHTLEHLTNLLLVEKSVENFVIHVPIQQKVGDAEESELLEHILDILILVSSEKRLAVADSVLAEVCIELLNPLVHFENCINGIVDLLRTWQIFHFLKCGIQLLDG